MHVLSPSIPHSFHESSESDRSPQPNRPRNADAGGWGQYTRTSMLGCNQVAQVQGNRILCLEHLQEVLIIQGCSEALRVDAALARVVAQHVQGNMA